MAPRKAPTWDHAEKNPVSTTAAPAKALHTVCLADVEPEEIHWLWYPYIPAGKLTSIEGDPGLGKSWITCAIAKAVAGGERLPGMREPLPPQKVLIASAEDGLADTIVPRLQGMGANLENIYCIDGLFCLDKQGIRSLAVTMEKFAAAIVFIDPLVAYLGGRVDMHKANEVREVMEGLKTAAERSGTSIVTVRHLRKASSSKDIYRGMGSIDFTAACRSVLFVEESKSGVSMIRHIKANYAAKGPAIAYELTPGEPIDGGNVWSSGSFAWRGLVADIEQESVCTTSAHARERARDFLFDLLKKGRMRATAVQAAAEKADISMATLNRAKRGVAYSVRRDEEWYWTLVGGEGTTAEEIQI